MDNHRTITYLWHCHLASSFVGYTTKRDWYDADGWCSRGNNKPCRSATVFPISDPRTLWL